MGEYGLSGGGLVLSMAKEGGDPRFSDASPHPVGDLGSPAVAHHVIGPVDSVAAETTAEPVLS